MVFPATLYPLVDEVLAECKAMKREGYHLYDSIEYLENIGQFIRGEPVKWRRMNKGVCDSPDLYFAIRPNGDLAVCCDHILAESYPVWHPDFPRWYRDREIHDAVQPLAAACTGCMYGSFPEISITSHFPKAALERVGVFFHRSQRPKPWPVTSERLLEIAADITENHPVNHTRSAALLEHVPAHADVTRRRLPVLAR